MDITDYFYKANYLFSIHKYKEAIDGFTHIIEMQPNFVDAYILRGAGYGEIGEYEKAIDDHTHVIELQPNYRDAYYNRGINYRYLREYKKAIDDFTTVIGLDPNYAGGYSQRSTTYLKLQENDKAINDLNIAIKLQPNYPTAITDRGTAYSKIKKYDKAINDLTLAIKLQPDYAPAYFNRAGVYYELKKYADAIMDFTVSIKLQFNSVEVHYFRGMCYDKVGKYNEALNDYCIAIEMGFDKPEVYINRSRIYLKKEEYHKAYTNLVIVEELCTDDMKLFKYSNDLMNFYKFHESPFLLNRITKRLYSLNTLLSYKEIIHRNIDECNNIIDLLNFFETNNLIDKSKFELLKGVLTYYLGDPSTCYKIFDEKVDINMPENLMGQYYFVLSCDDYIKSESEPIWESAKVVAAEIINNEDSIDILQYYYAGQIFFLNKDFTKATECFTKCNGYIPALCMIILCNHSLEDYENRDLLLDELIILDKENKGLLQYSYIPKLSINNFEESLLKYCHIKEIEGVIPLTFDRKHLVDDLIAENYKKISPSSEDIFIIDEYSEDGKQTLEKIKTWKEDVLNSFCSKIEKVLIHEISDFFTNWNQENDKDKLELDIASTIPLICRDKVKNVEIKDLIDYFTVKEKIDYHARFLLTYWAELNKYANRSLTENEKKAVKYSIGFLFKITLTYFNIPELNIVPSLVILLGEQLTKEYFTQKIIEFIEATYLKSDVAIPNDYSSFKSEFINYFEGIDSLSEA